MLDKIQFIINGECVRLKLELIEFNGEPDHVHMVISYQPSLSISSLVNVLKSMTSREMKLCFPVLNQVAWRKMPFGIQVILPVPLEVHQSKFLNSTLFNKTGHIRLLRNLGYSSLTANGRAFRRFR